MSPNLRDHLLRGGCVYFTAAEESRTCASPQLPQPLPLWVPLKASDILLLYPYHSCLDNCPLTGRGTAYFLRDGAISAAIM